MTHYATYFDRHYLERGLALYRSLARHSEAFVLWALCLDEPTFQLVSRLQLPGLRPVQLGELEQWDPALASVRATRRTVEYYWTCGPAFLQYLWSQHAALESLTYLDADLFFFDDPATLHERLGAGSILLIEHRGRSLSGGAPPRPYLG